MLLPSVHAETLTGRVVRVTDGDTIVILGCQYDPSTRYGCRVLIPPGTRPGIWYEVQKENLSELVAGKSVVVDYS